MISKVSLAEAVAALRTVLATLARSATDAGDAGADLTYACSLLAADAPTKIAGYALGADLLNCFTLAVGAGATQATMVAVYTTATTLTPASKPAITVVAACKGFAVSALARIVVAATFTSRDDVDAALATLGDAFVAVQSAAGNALLTDQYQALIAQQSAVTSYLTDESYPLPEQVTYTVGRTQTALSLAQRLYGDASRAGELAAENQVFNPAFMPLTGRALSA